MHAEGVETALHTSADRIEDRGLPSLGSSNRERERDLYFSVVTGTRYGTKTPPGRQPAN